MAMNNYGRPNNNGMKKTEAGKCEPDEEEEDYENVTIRPPPQPATGASSTTATANKQPGFITTMKPWQKWGIIGGGLLLLMILVAVCAIGWTLAESRRIDAGSAETPKAKACELLAECQAGIGWIWDLFEDTTGQILVSGDRGIVQCSTSGGRGELIPGPTQGLVRSTVIDPYNGTMWSIAYDPDAAYSTPYLYRQNSSADWYRESVSGMSSSHQPLHLDIDEDGQLVVISNRNLLFILNLEQPGITMNAKRSQSVSSSGVDWVWLESGYVALADSTNSRAIMYTPYGQQLPLVNSYNGVKIRYPKGINGDRNGNIVISNTGYNMISVFSLAGNHVVNLCENQISSPTSVLVTRDNGKLLVAEFGVVKVFKYDP